MSLFDLFCGPRHARPRERQPCRASHRQCPQNPTQGAAAVHFQRRPESVHPPRKNFIPDTARVIHYMPASQSFSNKFKTLPLFIVDFLLHTRHSRLSTYVTRLINIVIWSGPSCRRAGSCSSEGLVSVSLPRAHTALPDAYVTELTSLSRQLCLPRDCRT